MTMGLGLGNTFNRLGVLPGGGAHINFSPIQLTLASSAGTVVGTATVVGASGVPVWSLTASFGGAFAISSNTGVVTVALSSLLVAGIDPITIHAAGTTPAVRDRTFGITVVSTGTAAFTSPIYAGLMISGV